MTRHFLCLSLAAVMIAGCATAPRLTLDQVKKRRVYEGSKEEIMNAVRLFSTREAFKIHSFEEERGRIAGFKSVTFPRMDDPRVVRMQISVLPDSPGKWEVSAVFLYSTSGDVLSRDEESLLVECHVLLFAQIDQVAK
jgi:hypothetical protein